MISLLLAIRTESEANLREHWAQKAKRARTQRAIVKTMLRPLKPKIVDPGGYSVVLTRIAPRPLDDDNLARSFKAIRDGIAEAIGMDDNVKSKLKWGYAQERGPSKQYAVRIQIRPRQGQPL